MRRPLLAWRLGGGGFQVCREQPSVAFHQDATNVTDRVLRRGCIRWNKIWQVRGQERFLQCNRVTVRR